MTNRAKAQEYNSARKAYQKEMKEARKKFTVHVSRLNDLAEESEAKRLSDLEQQRVQRLAIKKQIAEQNAAEGGDAGPSQEGEGRIR
jgi:hypothetical protein